MKRGKFIVFEGIDGCGKGTQVKLAASFIFSLNKEYDLLLTREPTRDFKEIRERLAKGTDAKKDAEWYAKMFIADRKNHIAKYILPALDNGTHVISDRYKHSTLAYQHTQGIGLNKLIEMHLGILVPDLTIIVDCPAEIAFKRRREEGATDVFDKDLEFQEALRQNYLKLKDVLKGEIIAIVDGTRSVEEVFDEVKRHIKQIL
jgi:dTMP kinase